MTAVKLGTWEILGDGSTRRCDKPANFFGGREGIILYGYLCISASCRDIKSLYRLCTVVLYLCNYRKPENCYYEQ